ncbi:S8 family serine peptidase [Parachitinimonas caeni]|uniref:S8 family serine peptidase n=1 Tax=Parachitinimonas caeni TaxID=3031301 RepID=A0ABT7DRT4_9NEIS|nr:S8 family serine peptidase [Parachitinimonas caeni]MDK2122773.1 S8 family serine peptidase [Parachitinimonas caeni]
MTALALPSLAQAATGLVPDQILVKYRAQPGFAAAQSADAVRTTRAGVQVLRVDGQHFAMADASDRRLLLQQKLAELRADPNVIYAEPDYYGEFADMPVPVATPNDPGVSQAWNLEKIGARQLWSVASGNGIKVAVVDSGVDLTHPDLKDNLLPGYNFGDRNANPQDQLGHGTKVSGLLAAVRGNALAGAGVAPLAKLLPIKINAGASGTFKTSDVADSVDYAVAQGAKVINLSLTIDEDTQTLAAAIERAKEAGVVVVVASGNQGGAVAFPATIPGVIAVGASNESDQLAGFSNTGPEVTIAAPGTNLYSTLLGGGFGGAGQGTSFAAPTVSGVVAALLEVDPRLGSSQIASLLKQTAKPIAGNTVSYGIVQGGAAMLTRLPDLTLPKKTFAAGDSLTLDYSLPPTAGLVDIYVAVRTPNGEFGLMPDGRWQDTSQGYPVLAKGYQASGSLHGQLFGGVFPPIALTGLPAGVYTWRTGLVDPVAGRVVGTIIETPMTLQ